MITDVPLLVPPPFASRHMVPESCNWRPEVYVQTWLDWPAQSCNCTWVPALWLGAVTHRPDWPPTICWPCPGPPVELGEVDGVGFGVVPPNWVKKFHTTSLVQVRSPPPLSAVDPS